MSTKWMRYDMKATYPPPSLPISHTKRTKYPMDTRRKYTKFIWIIKWTNKLLTRYKNCDKKKQRSIYSCNVRLIHSRTQLTSIEYFVRLFTAFNIHAFGWFHPRFSCGFFYSFTVVSRSFRVHFKWCLDAGCVVRSFQKRFVPAPPYLSNVKPLTFFTNRQIKHTYAHLMLLMW